MRVAKPLASPSPPLTSPPLLEVRNLVKHFPARSGGFQRRSRAGEVHAVCGISLDLCVGETVGLVGESGCGKSTAGRSILQLLPATSGSVRFQGHELTDLGPRQLRKLRADLQVVFQDPSASLNPRMPVREIIAEPLLVHQRLGSKGGGHITELLHTVGLEKAHADRYSHELSVGQRQRVAIARALALEPKALVLDEPVSALDVSLRAGLINLLERLQQQLGLAYLFIAHDLSVMRHISHRVLVMYLGKIVETGTSAEIYSRPSHPYTQALFSAVPQPDPDLERRRSHILLDGELPSPVSPPSGCRFRTRCPRAEEICADEEPALVRRGQGHPVACHFPGPIERS